MVVLITLEIKLCRLIAKINTRFQPDAPSTYFTEPVRQSPAVKLRERTSDLKLVVSSGFFEQNRALQREGLFRP